MIIYGASGHGKVIIDIARALGLEIEGIIDDDPGKIVLSGLKVKHHIPENITAKGVMLAIGDNAVRKKVFNQRRFEGHSAICHPSCVVSPSACIGKGTVVMAQAAINSDAVVGEHCIINTGAVIEHDVKLNDFVHISPNAALAGGVQVGEGTHIGIGAVIIQGVKIGKWVTIGAGAVIIRDIPDQVVVVGSPGRIIKHKS